MPLFPFKGLLRQNTPSNTNTNPRRRSPQMHIHPPGLIRLARVIALGQRHIPDNVRKVYFVHSPRWWAASWGVIKRVIHAGCWGGMKGAKLDCQFKRHDVH